MSVWQTIRTAIMDRPGWCCCRVYTGLADGSYTFRVVAVDASRDSGSPATFFFLVDTTPPVAYDFTFEIRRASNAASC